jgi:hypothetical protein
VEHTLKIAAARFAIETLLYGYAEAIDTGDIERLGTLLPACRIVMPNGGTLDGGAAIVEHYRGLIVFYDADERPVDYERLACSPRTRHIMSNSIFAFAPDVTSGTVRTCFTVYQNLDGQNPIIAGGRYEDRCSLSPQGWQIDERRIMLDHPGDLSRHLKQALT